MHKTLISLLFALLFLSSLTHTVSGDTFTGVGNKTTATFDSATYTKIEWITVASNEFDVFSTFIYKQGEALYGGSFDGSEGTTYLYDDGTFYFDVLAANIDSWEITTTPTSGDYFTDTVSGIASANTKLFECFGECEITWSTVAENEFDIFTVFIEPIVEDLFFFETFDGDSGSTFLYETGIYYFQVLAANLVSWTINLDITPGTETTDDPSNTDTSETQDGTDTSTDEESPGFVGTLVVTVFTTVYLIRHNSKKRL